MKRLILVNGTMGVGKSATCQALMRMLPASVFLDGDWCWKMSPFVVTDETKTMVMDNIVHLLGNFLNCSAYENVIFCWVMHEQEIVQQLRDKLRHQMEQNQCQEYFFSLICSQRALVQRLFEDVAAGIRQDDIIERSVPRLDCYLQMDSVKVDVTQITPEQAAQQILAYMGE